MVLQAPTLDFCLFSFGHMETMSQQVFVFCLLSGMFCVMLMLYTFKLAWNSYFYVLN